MLKREYGADYPESPLPYGYGFCNPAFRDQDPVSNQEYLATIPDTDPWYPVLVEGFKLLDLIDPEWRVQQIKEKFGECRFYLSGNEAARRAAFFIERACDFETLYEQKWSKKDG